MYVCMKACRACRGEKKARRMRISSPGTQIFPGNSLFQLFLFSPHISSYSRKKRRLGGGTKNILPGWSMHYIKHKYKVRSDLWAVIFSRFHSAVVVAGQTASAWVMLMGFSWYFTCSCPRWFRASAVHRKLEHHYQYYSDVIVLIVISDVRM